MARLDCRSAAPPSATARSRSISPRSAMIALVVLAGLTGRLPGNISAAEDGSLLAEQLATGEFAPALEQAQQAPADERDARLAAVAKAQAQAGERRASLATLGSMRDDVGRGQALGEVASASGARGAQGGGGNADFGSLISLITSTVAPTTWDEVGGPGTIAEYRQGVYVDALGVVRPTVEKRGANDGIDRLSDLRRTVEHGVAAGGARQASRLRKISLPRLEREIQMRLAAGQPLDDEMQVLAGLERIHYVLLYPDTGDIVLAGPAGDWTFDAENRIVSAQSGRPVVRLDDLVVLLRHIYSSPNGEFGCSINPSEDGLAKAKAFLDASSGKPLKLGQKGKWLKELRGQLGLQSIEIFGIDPRSRVAHVIVEADYRMKLVGIGLEKGTLDVPSYLDMIKLGRGEAPPPLDVLRWWFTINYDALLTNAARDVYELRGTGVKVLGENEMLTAAGKQIHTGKSDTLNSQFAHNFTTHFEALAAKYPVYADLQNVFDLALTMTLIKAEGLADRSGWHMLTFSDPQQFAVAQGQPPKAVETVMNHRVVNGKHILAAISGGVSVDCRSMVRPDAVETDGQGALASEHDRSTPEQVRPAAWWWD
jgi:hypothetical protein